MLTPAGRSRFPSFHTKGTRFHWIYKSCMAVYCPRNNEESNNLKIILKCKEKSFEPNPSIWSFKMFLFAGVWIQPLNIALKNLRLSCEFHSWNEGISPWCIFSPKIFRTWRFPAFALLGGQFPTILTVLFSVSWWLFSTTEVVDPYKFLGIKISCNAGYFFGLWEHIKSFSQGEQRLNGVIALQHKGIWLPPELPGLNTWEVVNIEVRNSHDDLNPHSCTKNMVYTDT